ncbi:piRNA biogenesis protein EXD1 isoform X1 [Bufo gargarizans]|uniref:piRNA biogenesis protein EXD1 isoform X1 n=1 Tax=Bufo gargarizans TaxID=30331 RepID=UPI001CF3B75B|nr:piRNA biogenesis protein EXD1 isoform X1 [Bufo gargarizans]
MDRVTETDFLRRLIGTTVKVTTVHGCFQGELSHIHADRAILLIRVKDLSADKPLPGAKLFFGQAILNVEMVEEPSDHVGLERDEPVDESSGNTLSQPGVKHEEIDATTLQRLKQSIDSSGADQDINYIVIDQFQPSFGPAIRHLQNQKVLGLATVALNVSRHGKLCWLQIASKSYIYLFDILLLGPRVFKNGLQMVLEDKGILKVVHDGRWLGSFLAHQYSVELKNVFDTQVADVYLFSMETAGFLPSCTSTVKECLTRYLKLSPSQVSFLIYKETLVKNNPSIWCDRPLPTAALKLLSLEVVHLLPLRSAMLDAMLADYTLLVDGYLNTCSQGSPDMLPSSEPTSRELPKELQQLSVLQQRRRERALKEHEVNGLGFLIRAEI